MTMNDLVTIKQQRCAQRAHTSAKWRRSADVVPCESAYRPIIVSTESTNVTNGQTDIQTDGSELP